MMMNHCLLALAKVFYGLKTHEIRVLQDGMRLYGGGLRMLKDVLDEANSSFTTELLVSVVSLCIGEVCTLMSPILLCPWHILTKIPTEHDANQQIIVGDSHSRSRESLCPKRSLHG